MSGIRNVSEKILQLTKRKLLNNQNHPLSIIRGQINTYFDQKYSNIFTSIIKQDPIVSTYRNFDSLNVPKDHISRQPSDTYYFSEDQVLRTHTSAHQVEMLENNVKAFLVSGDVYRRDTIDATHYPAFHQMEGVRIWDKQEMTMDGVLKDLKQVLDGLAVHLFGDIERRWIDVTFPFTDPSLELEIFYQGD